MLPLEGIRIIAIEQYGAGPWATLHLADLGAEVIKIEDPTTGGDVARYVPPYVADHDSVYFQSLNRNKKSICLNLRHPKGRAILLRLVERADAVFNNLRGDVPAKLGLDYAALRDINRGLVCCSLSSFGRHNSRTIEPGYDYIMQAYSGWMTLAGEPDGPPVKTGLSVVDLSAGILAAFGLVCGILRAKRTGEGCDVDVSLFDTAFSELTYIGAWALSRGYEPKRARHSSHPSQIPSQIFQTANGYIAIMCAKEKFWQNLCDAVGHPEWATDTRFRTFSDRLENRDVLVKLLEDVFLEQSTEEWLSRLQRSAVPCGPVNSISAALQDPLVAENDLIIEIDHPELGKVRQLATAVKLGGESKQHQRAPVLGIHTEELLKEMNFSQEEINLLRREGVV
jgi:crotonobetainyl-CoA:carnitine CoA-transferase CaiB-like acyl-CoA transferase